MTLRNELGPYFGEYGGRFVPESLIAALDELDAAYQAAKIDPVFQEELANLHKTYTGRPSIITEVPRFAEHAGGARIILKREDLNHTGSHKINNVLGQALVARRQGSTELPPRRLRHCSAWSASSTWVRSTPCARRSTSPACDCWAPR
jgi:tryptophan synthase beta chain